MAQSQLSWIGRIIGSRYKLVGALVTVLILGFVMWLLFLQVFPFAALPGEQLQASSTVTAQGVLLQDEFANSSSGWPSESQANASFGYQSPTFYYLEVKAPDDSLVVFPGLNFVDFTVETKVLVNFTDTPKGDFRYGLAIRRSGEQYYAFTISPRTETWQVRKHSPAGWEVLDEGKHDSIQGLFQVSTLTVEANGAAFSFHVNSQPVIELTDLDYASGDAGFIVETVDESLVRVIYDSLIIREIKDQPGVDAPTAIPVSPSPGPSSTPAAIIALPTLPPTPSTLPTAALAPPTPTSSSTPTAIAALPTLRLTPSPVSTATPVPPSPTPSPLPAATPVPLTPTPGSAPPATPTPSPTSSVPAGTFVLLNPLTPDQPTFGPVDFEWAWTGAVPAGHGFEVRVWREDEPPAGAHDAVLDNQQGVIKSIGENKYRFHLDIRNAAGVRARSGEYLWTVALVQISPNYADLGQQASPARFRFEAGGGGGGDGGDGGGGGGGGDVGVD